MYKKIILAIATLVLFSGLANGIEWKHYLLANENGLSSGNPTSLYQDSKGLLWIGTWNGLNLYNGHTFKTYTNSPGDLNTISNNVIGAIDGQDNGVIWIATDNGINRIDVYGNKVSRFFSDEDQMNPLSGRSFFVCTAKDNRVFCSATDYGTTYYDEKTGKMIPFNIPGFNTNLAGKIFSSGDNTLLVWGIDSSLVETKYDFSKDGEIRIYDTKPILQKNKIYNTFCCKRNLYVVTTNGLVLKYDRNTCKVVLTEKLPFRTHVTEIAEKNNGEIIIATMEDKVFTYQFGHGILSEVPELSGAKVESLLYGTQGILWAALDGEGVEALYQDKASIKKLLGSEIGDKQNAAFVSITGDDYGNLYIGTQGKGLYIISKDGTQKIVNRSKGLSNDVVYCIKKINEDEILIGSLSRGIDIYSIRTGKISQIYPFPDKQFGSIYSICYDPIRNYMWFGSIWHGLYGAKIVKKGNNYVISDRKYFVNVKKNEHTLSSNMIVTMARTGNNGLWIGTLGGGLNYMDLNTGKMESFKNNPKNSKSVSSNNILSIYIAKDSTIWLGTSYGLDKMVKGEDGQYEFSCYAEKDGLPDNTVHAIQEDNKGNLWVSTNKGLAFMDLSTHTFTAIYNNKLLQGNEFSNNSSYKDKNGYIYFGGIRGLNYFLPSEIKMRTFEPTVILTKFSVRQKQLPDFNPDMKMILKHNENFFSIDFSAIDYIDNDNCEYSYKLNGFNDEWLDIGTEHSAVFTNVPPGKYTFIVRCTNGDKVWSSKTTEMKIVIRRPWWNSLWGFALYIIFGCASIYLIWRYLRERIEQKHRLEMESMSKEQQKDTYEAKLRFFTNIAHEFGTPLTLICGSSDQLINRHDLGSKQEKYVNIIRDSAERMQRLIQELMEFRKVEAGKYKLIYGKVDIAELTSKILENFSEISEVQKIKVHSSIPTGNTEIVSDKNAIEKIMYNLISNAFKYTPESGSINIDIGLDSKGTTISIRNSGKGIKPENLHNVFDRFVILDNFEQQAKQGKIMRNGIGLALVQTLVNTLSGEIEVSSQVGEYTEFLVKLPSVPEDEISAEAQTVIENVVESKDVSIDMPSEETPTVVSGQSVMIVDDEKQIRDLVKEILGNEYKVITATDGLDAIEVLKHGLPDLIITDISMPNLDGIGLLKFLKENELTKHIPIIFLTFKSDMENEVSSYELGSEAFIPKPFYTKHLIAVVHQILRNRSSLKDYYSSAISNRDVYEDTVVDSEDKKFIVQLTNLIEENMENENLSPDFICEKMFISKMQLYRRLKKIASATPSEFIRKIKINHAAHLLKTTRLTVLEVMFRSGFNYKSYFYKEFAAIYHMSPKEYRENNKANV
jgi:signal transduction histidine kinase/ligand-binding sensor domain-containing protein/DNA-binding response OmpR family regulator